MSDLPGAPADPSPDRPSAAEIKHVELRLQDLDWRLDVKWSSRQAEDRHRALDKMLDDPERGYEIVLNFGETRFGQPNPDLLTPMLELVRRGAELPPPMRAQLIEHLRDPQIVHEIADAAVGLVRPEFAKYNNQHLVDQVLGQLDQVIFDDLSAREIFALEVPATYTVFGMPTTRSVPFGIATAVYASHDPFTVVSFRHAGNSTLSIEPGSLVFRSEPLSFGHLDFSPLVRLSHMADRRARGYSSPLIAGSAYLGIEAAISSLDPADGFFAVGIAGLWTSIMTLSTMPSRADRPSQKVASLYFSHMVPRTLEILEERQRRRPPTTATPEGDNV